MKRPLDFARRQALVIACLGLRRLRANRHRQADDTELCGRRNPGNRIGRRGR